MHALVLTGRLVALLVVPVVAWWMHRFATRRLRPARARPWAVAPASMQVEAAPADRTADAQAAQIVPTRDFEVADRIVSIRLDPPVGVINLRVYHALGLVKRDLIVNEPCLRALMKGRRHTLPDVPYQPAAGLDAIKDETTQAVERLINELGSRAARAARPRQGDARPRRGAAPADLAHEAASERSDNEPSREEVAGTGEGAQPALKAAQPLAGAAAPRATSGFTYVGKLVKAGFQTQKPGGRYPYEVFEATLQLANGAELALRGAELERELTAAGCAVGHHVAITPMGKVPVTLGNGSEGQKNVYRVKRMDAALRG
ncbi:hypothetical protein [Ramlibacter sp. AN1133]|uniref:hypothetical protein n=1 Tax=Ramlibacter sp. AN1133 TaxID=3133429 RepID=UPI0030BF488C